MTSSRDTSTLDQELPLIVAAQCILRASCRHYVGPGEADCTIMDRSMDASGTGSAYSSNGSFESSLVRYPCRTVCNLFWGNRLASRPFTCGDTPISFPSLWPDVAVFTSLYREGGLAAALPDIVRLLLATGGYPQLDGLQKSGQLSWEHELEQDKCTLIHMVCALNCEPLLEAALKQVPQNGLLTIKDAQGE